MSLSLLRCVFKLHLESSGERGGEGGEYPFLKGLLAAERCYYFLLRATSESEQCVAGWDRVRIPRRPRQQTKQSENSENTGVRVFSFVAGAFLLWVRGRVFFFCCGCGGAFVFFCCGGCGGAIFFLLRAWGRVFFCCGCGDAVPEHRSWSLTIQNPETFQVLKPEIHLAALKPRSREEA